MSVANGEINIDGKSYPKDSWTNLPTNMLNSIPSRLHLQPDHPISLTRSVIESFFPAQTFAYYNTFSPVVSTHQNFDSLGFPLNHPGRSKSDTYYVNSTAVLRTHTSAHQSDLFRANRSQGYLISADVYRRDAIDRSHYPIFHQMEGVRIWDRNACTGGNISATVRKDTEKISKSNLIVSDQNHLAHPERNPIQNEHSHDEVEAVVAHLKRSLEFAIFGIFSRAVKPDTSLSPELKYEPLKLRWIESYFPFTSPSWELEIFWENKWLEVLGCGVVKQSILNQANVPHQMGWAFGLGLERISMLLFGIPDIRLFWCRDHRFLDQFKGLSKNLDKLNRFIPFSKYPGTYRDISFWIPSTQSSADNHSNHATHENDIMQIVRDVAGDVVEDVSKIDEFMHSGTRRISWCYRVYYRSLEKTLTNTETNLLHESVKKELTKRLNIELR